MKNHLQFHWGKYLAAIVIPIVLWSSVFSILKKPAPNEKLSILFVGEGLDTVSVQQEVERVLPELTDQKLQSISISQAAPGNMGYFEFMHPQIYRYDIIIITQSQCLENTGQVLFRTIPQALQDAFSFLPFYTESTEAGDRPYGLVICDEQLNNRFSSFYEGSEICYLFFSPESENLAGKNGKGNPSDDCALQIARYLLEIVN